MKDYQFDQKHTCRNLQRDDHKLNSLCSAEKHAHHFHSSVCVSIWCNESKCIDLGDAIKQVQLILIAVCHKAFHPYVTSGTQCGTEIKPLIVQNFKLHLHNSQKKKKKLIKKIYINT